MVHLTQWSILKEFISSQALSYQDVEYTSTMEKVKHTKSKYICLFLFLSNLHQIDAFHQVFQFPPPNKTEFNYMYNINEIILKITLDSHKLKPFGHEGIQAKRVNNICVDISLAPEFTLA